MVFAKILGNLLMKMTNIFHRFRTWGLIIPVYFLASCSTVSNIPLEISHVPKEAIDPDIQSLTLVNGAINSRFDDYKGDSLQQTFFQRQFKADTLLYDTRAADTLLIALGNLLFESGRFDIVIPEERILPNHGDHFFPTMLDWNIADTIVRNFQTDALLSLDLFRTRVVTDYKKETLYDQSTGEFFAGYHAQMAVAYESMFRIYYPAQKQVVKNILIRDTLMWEDFDYEIRPLFNRFTPVKQAMAEAAIHSALRLSEQIAPIWQRVNRAYFDKGHVILEQAGLAVKSGDWATAIKLWHDLEKSDVSKSVLSKAQYNLALGYEITGTIEEAIEWGVKSYETKYRPITYNYLEILGSRKKQLENQ
jgi:tetratricopeptide (TPR) repeat protein